MAIIQLTGLSGAGKTTLSNILKKELATKNIVLEILDGDIYRMTLCKDLSFTKGDREENIRRLAKFAQEKNAVNKIIIICAINPYENIRQELKSKYDAKVVWINCKLEVLIKRDTKGLYKRAMYPENENDRLLKLTGINDPYENPNKPDLTIHTHLESQFESSRKLYNYITEVHRSAEHLGQRIDR